MTMTNDMAGLVLRLTGRDARASDPRIDRTLVTTTFVAVRQKTSIRLPWIRIEIRLSSWNTKENGVVHGEGKVLFISDLDLEGLYTYAVIHTGPRPRGEEYAGRIFLYPSDPMELEVSSE
jgi:hypothetical protein